MWAWASPLGQDIGRATFCGACWRPSYHHLACTLFTLAAPFMLLFPPSKQPYPSPCMMDSAVPPSSLSSGCVCILMDGGRTSSRTVRGGTWLWRHLVLAQADVVVAGHARRISLQACADSNGMCCVDGTMLHRAFYLVNVPRNSPTYTTYHHRSNTAYLVHFHHLTTPLCSLLHAMGHGTHGLPRSTVKRYRFQLQLKAGGHFLHPHSACLRVALPQAFASFIPNAFANSAVTDHYLMNVTFSALQKHARARHCTLTAERANVSPSGRCLLGLDIVWRWRLNKPPACVRVRLRAQAVEQDNCGTSCLSRALSYLDEWWRGGMNLFSLPSPHPPITFLP